MLQKEPVAESAASSQPGDEKPKSIPVHCEHSARVEPKLLKPHPLNPNVHSADQIDLFIAILEYQGWRRPITISNRSGYITKGHGAREAALKAGFYTVPVDYQNYEDEAQELADLAADNQLQRMSVMNNDKLQQLIAKIDENENFNLEMTGFRTEKIDTIMEGFEGWAPKIERINMSVPDAYEPETYAKESESSGGPAEGEPYEEGAKAYNPPLESRGLSKDELKEFSHKCPKCSFEFD